MLRVSASIFLVAVLLSLPFGFIAFVAFPVILFFSAVIGVPIALVVRRYGWTRWWQSVSGGVVCAIAPTLMLSGFDLNRALVVEPLATMIFLGMGAAGGLIVWIVGVFRNPQFVPVQTRIPTSMAVLPAVLVAFFFYAKALTPEYFHACTVAYEELEAPTPRRHALVTFETDDGQVATATVSQGYAKADMVGNCAWLSAQRSALLLERRYKLVSPVSGNCSKACATVGTPEE